jgi:hypothetical protein
MAPTPHFTVRVSHRREALEASGDSKDRFWRQFRRTLADDEFGPSRLENALRNRLPAALSERAAGHRLLRGQRVGDGEVSAPVFSIVSLDYGSLNIGMVVEPVEQAVKFFDGNFDYFRVFLQAYVPVAFEAALWQAEADCEFKISYEPAFATRFATLAKASSVPAPTSLSETRARWAWIAANTSLVVPTVLAAIYMYYASVDAKEWTTLREKAMSSLADQQRTQLAACQASLTSLAATRPCCISGSDQKSQNGVKIP